MNNLLLILTILMTIAISGCTTATAEILKPAETQTHQNESPTVDALACKEKGGMIKKVCMLNTSFCVQKHLDAGKKCSDSSECAGDCRIENQFVEVGSKASGFCSKDNDPCGCFQIIEKGIAQQALCVD